MRDRFARPARDTRLLWATGVVLVPSFVTAMQCTFDLAVAAWYHQRLNVHEAWLVVPAIVATALLARSFWLRFIRTDPVMRFFDWIDETLIEESEPEDASYWTERLAMRLARLKRLQSLKAPKLLVDSSLELVRQAAAHLEPSQALSIMGLSEEMLKQFDDDDEAGETQEETN